MNNQPPPLTSYQSPPVVFYITYTNVFNTKNQHCQIECYSKEQCIEIFNKTFTNCYILKIETTKEIAETIACKLVSSIMCDINKLLDYK